MVSMLSEEGRAKAGVYEYVIDTVDELSDVPTDVHVGSVVYCIENSKKYMLNNSGTYVEVNFKKGGSGGEAKLGTKEINENGVYQASDFDLDGWSEVDVSVPMGVFPSGSIPITQNGQVDVTQYAMADVNVSGGGASLIPGVLRPDAELWKSWTYDKWIVANEGATIPSYTTTETTLKSSETLDTVTLDPQNYYYAAVTRLLSYPEYSIQTYGSGRFVAGVAAYFSEYILLPKSVYPSSSTEPYVGSYNSARSEILYYSSTTQITEYNNSSGIYQTFTAPSLSNGAITVKSPNFMIKGNGTYYKNTYMNATTDARYQYVINLYRVPWGSLNVDGYALGSSYKHILACLGDSSKKLT